MIRVFPYNEGLSSRIRATRMTSLLRALTGLFSRVPTEQDRDAAYLAQAADIYDLERRMRQLDSVGHSLYARGPYGIFMR